MKYGKKNQVSLNPLDYNTCILGESKVGKTTLIHEVCQKLVGEDGYLFCEMGAERGADAIEGIPYVNCTSWAEDYDELEKIVNQRNRKRFSHYYELYSLRQEKAWHVFFLYLEHRMRNWWD